MNGPPDDSIRPDVHREARLGLPEVVYGPGKTAAQIAAVVERLLAANTGPVLATRVEPDVAAAVLPTVPGSRTPPSSRRPSGPDADVLTSAPGTPGLREPGCGADAREHGGGGEYDEAARLLVWRAAPARGFEVAVVSAGTSDGAVAAEACAVASAVGLTVSRVADVGVAGLHRVLAERDRLAASDAVICIAGMEGALPSVVGGLVGCPVIAVPTSVGYGANLGGMTTALAMLSSCAPGVVVVNIDSGFGAALAAYRIAAGR